MGNICRSPTAGSSSCACGCARLGYPDRVEVDSAGTGSWHAGNPADERAVAILTAHGYDGTHHVARQFEPQWCADRDLIVAMDGKNVQSLRWMAPAEGPSQDRAAAVLRPSQPGRRPRRTGSLLRRARPVRHRARDGRGGLRRAAQTRASRDRMTIGRRDWQLLIPDIASTLRDALVAADQPGVRDQWVGVMDRAGYDGSRRRRGVEDRLAAF